MKYRKLTAALIKEMEATAKRHRVRLAIFDMDPIMPGERAPELQGVVNIGNFRFNGPEYRVARQPQNHPNDKVHAYWAQKTIEWIDANHWLDFGKTTQGVASRK